MEQHKFPDLSNQSAYSASLEENPIKIDGQKVLFDKKVTLLPVELKKEDKGK